MEIASRDYRPLSALSKDSTSPAERLAGFTSAGLGLLAFGLILFANLGAMSGEEARATDAPSPTIIEASFVQLGREFAPNELPDRQIERSSLHRAAPQEVASPDARPKSETPKPPEEPPEEPPKDSPKAAPLKDSPPNETPPERPEPVDSYEDLLDQLGNRAEYFDRLSRAEMEGSPDGVSEGDQREGDAYRGTLYALFRRGLVAPSTIPDDVLKNLRAEVEFTINELLRIRGLRLISSSGNADFDRAIERRIAELNESDPLLPAPPAHQRATFIGPPIRMIVTPPRSLGASASPSTASPSTTSPSGEGARGDEEGKSADEPSRETKRNETSAEEDAAPAGPESSRSHTSPAESAPDSP